MEKGYLRKVYDKYDPVTLDIYRNYITQANFLKIKSRGVYVKLEDVNLTLEEVRKKAYNKNKS